MSESRRRPYPEHARARIRGSKILGRLLAHAEGVEEMTPSEVKAALGLLDRILPVLKATEITQNIDRKNTISAEPLTEEQWFAKYGSLGGTNIPGEQLGH
jgi:hypothetical protein